MSTNTGAPWGVPQTSDALPAGPLPLLLLEALRDPADGRVRGRSRLAFAVRGACLAELVAAERLVDAGGQPVVRVSASATPVPALPCATVEAVARQVAGSGPRSWKHVVRSRALRTFDAATDELVARGTWTRRSSGAWGRSFPRFSGGEDRTLQLRQSLYDALLGTGDVEPRLAVLASLVDAGGALGVVVGRSERRRAHRRAQQLTSLVGEQVGAVVRDVLVSVVAAASAGAAAASGA